MGFIFEFIYINIIFKGNKPCLLNKSNIFTLLNIYFKKILDKQLNMSYNIIVINQKKGVRIYELKNHKINKQRTRKY